MRTSTTAVDDFSSWQEARSDAAKVRRYEKLIPLAKPGNKEQYAFEVNLDQCTGCKACVVACHSLNGLDADESWRDVGLLLGTQDEPYLQTVTTACHHCVDPACSNGCPVLAYEKDPTTGIVRHLDDQCIGCSYCILKCPYDVPKFNRKRGIVRKCDMCHGRLATGEAPACVQACPTQAIAIRIVPRQSNPVPMMPGLVDSCYTSPQTRYIGKRAIPASSVAADAADLRVEAAHTPLAVMLVLTQLAAGAWIAATIQPSDTLRWMGLMLSLLGIGTSTLHLGQPLKAWRSFLGWKKSWLSREIIAFGALSASGTASVFDVLPEVFTAAISLAAVFCSIMVYADTRRPFWCFSATTGKFLGTTLLSASLFSAMLWPSIVIGLIKLLSEANFLRTTSKSAKLLLGPLRKYTAARFVIGFPGLLLLPVSFPAASLVLMAGELLERITFFKAVVAYKMPGS